MNFLKFIEWPEGYELLRVIYNIVMSCLAVGLLYLKLFLKKPKCKEKNIFEKLDDEFALIELREELEYELELEEEEIHKRALKTKIEAINAKLNLSSHPPDD